MKKYIKRFIYLFIFIGFVSAFGFCLSSCEKQNTVVIPQGTEGVSDHFIEDEVIEEIDTTIDERDDTPIYQSDAENKIDFVLPLNGTVSDLIEPENDCTSFRYGSYFVPRQEIKVAFIYANDNLRSIDVSDGVIKNLRKDTRNNKVWYFSLDSMTKNLERISFTFNLNADSPQKYIRFLNHDPNKSFYGTSQWGRAIEREALGLSIKPDSQPQNITSSYLPPNLHKFPQKAQNLLNGNSKWLSTILYAIIVNQQNPYRFPMSQRLLDVTKSQSRRNTDANFFNNQNPFYNEIYINC